MPVNDRISNNSQDIGYAQLAPSQVGRTNFTPGTIDPVRPRPNETPWPIDFRVPVGPLVFREAALGPALKTFNRIVKLGRGIVCDQVIPAPVTSGTITTTITSPKEWGVVSPISVVTDTDTKPNPAIVEKTSGSNVAEPNV